MSDDLKRDDLEPDRVGHDGKHLTTDQGVMVERTDAPTVTSTAVSSWSPA